MILFARDMLVIIQQSFGQYAALLFLERRLPRKLRGNKGHAVILVVAVPHNRQFGKLRSVFRF